MTEHLTEEETGVRFRVYPTRIQQQVLNRWIGAQRYLYNWKVEELDYHSALKTSVSFPTATRRRARLLPLGPNIFSIRQLRSLDHGDPKLRPPQRLRPI